jgi:hypothetical protein
LLDKKNVQRSIFIKVLPRPSKCVSKLLRRSGREPMGEIQFEKNGNKTKWKGGNVFIEPLGGEGIFQGSVENPLRVFVTGEVVSRPSKSIVKIF